MNDARTKGTVLSVLSDKNSTNWIFLLITQREPSLLCTFAFRKILGYGKRTERPYKKERELLAVV